MKAHLLEFHLLEAWAWNKSWIINVLHANNTKYFFVMLKWCPKSWYITLGLTVPWIVSRYYYSWKLTAYTKSRSKYAKVTWSVVIVCFIKLEYTFCVFCSHVSTFVTRLIWNSTYVQLRCFHSVIPLTKHKFSRCKNNKQNKHLFKHSTVYAGSQLESIPK